MTAPVYGDRVQETFTTTGTGTMSLAGAVIGYQTFSDVLSNADTCYYCATDGINWEVGLGTYATSGNTLARTTILASSNSGAAVAWSAGTKNIWLDFPAAAVPGASPIASSSVPGIVMPDGTILTINTSTGALTAAQATSSIFGVVKVDGTTITASGGVISATVPTPPSLPAAVTSALSGASAVLTVDFATYSAYDIYITGATLGSSPGESFVIDVSQNAGSGYVTSTFPSGTSDIGGDLQTGTGANLVGTIVQGSSTGPTLISTVAALPGDAAANAKTIMVSYATTAAVNRVKLTISGGASYTGGKVILQPKSLR